MLKKYLFTLAILSLVFATYAAAGVVGSAFIRAPAVVINNNTGSLTNISLVVTNGTGTVSVVGPQNVGQSTTQSAKIAAMYASNFTRNNFYNYNFTYNITNAGEKCIRPKCRCGNDNTCGIST